MEWITPKVGATRTRRVFAWIPVDCEDGITRWLCRIRIDETYDWVNTARLYNWATVRAYV